MRQHQIFMFVATITAASVAFSPSDIPLERKGMSLDYAKNLDTIVPEYLDNSTKRNAKIIRPNKQKSSHDMNWLKRFDQISEFYSTHGHSDVPYTYQDKGLSRWVTNQRQNYKKGVASMTEERCNALNSIGFTWETRFAWESRFAELKEFSETNGHLNISHDAESGKHLDLVRFMAAQRHQHKLRNSGKNGGLSDARFASLTSIGFPFHVHEKAHSKVESAQNEKVFSASDRKWEEQFRALKHYFHTHGDSMVPQHYEKDPQLGLFVKNQRRQFQLMNSEQKSSMTKERKRKLESLEFVWNTRDYRPPSDSVDIIQIPIRQALQRSMERRKARINQIHAQSSVEENAELLLALYKHKSQWGV